MNINSIQSNLAHTLKRGEIGASSVGQKKKALQNRTMQNIASGTFTVNNIICCKGYSDTIRNGKFILVDQANQFSLWDLVKVAKLWEINKKDLPEYNREYQQINLYLDNSGAVYRVFRTYLRNNYIQNFFGGKLVGVVDYPNQLSNLQFHNGKIYAFGRSDFNNFFTFYVWDLKGKLKKSKCLEKMGRFLNYQCAVSNDYYVIFATALASESHYESKVFLYDTIRKKSAIFKVEHNSKPIVCTSIFMNNHFIFVGTNGYRKYKKIDKFYESRNAKLFVINLNTWDDKNYYVETQYGAVTHLTANKTHAFYLLSNDSKEDSIYSLDLESGEQKKLHQVGNKQSPNHPMDISVTDQTLTICYFTGYNNSDPDWSRLEGRQNRAVIDFQTGKLVDLVEYELGMNNTMTFDLEILAVPKVLSYETRIYIENFVEECITDAKEKKESEKTVEESLEPSEKEKKASKEITIINTARTRNLLKNIKYNDNKFYHVV